MKHVRSFGNPLVAMAALEAASHDLGIKHVESHLNLNLTWL